MKKQFKTELQQLQERHNFNIWDSLDDEKFNIIEAKAGTGKTTEVLKWVFESKSNIFGEEHNQFIYVSDTTNLKEQTHNEYVTELAEEKRIEIENLYINGEYGKFIPNSMKCMTYFGFFYWLEQNQDNIIKFDNKVIIFDECHNLTKYYNDFYAQYEFVERGLELIYDSFSTVICLSATPNKFINMIEDFGFEWNDVLGELKHELVGYTAKNTFKFNDDLVDFISSITFNKAYVYFAGNVEMMKFYAKELTKKGINTQYVCRRDKCELDTKEFINKLVATHEVPMDYDVILFNDAMGTGINIIDKEQMFDTFITYATKHEYLDNDNIYQARNRVRHDIEVEYRYTKAHNIKKADKDAIRTYEQNMERITIIESVLNEKLTTAEFKELAKELNFRNSKNGRLIANPKKELEELGYILTKKRIGKEKITVFIINK